MTHITYQKLTMSLKIITSKMRLQFVSNSQQHIILQDMRKMKCAMNTQLLPYLAVNFNYHPTGITGVYDSGSISSCVRWPAQGQF